MKICLVHYNKEGVDGVSVEIEKWQKALERLGHQVYYLVGKGNGANSVLVEELSLENGVVKKLHENLTVKLTDYKTCDELKYSIFKEASTITRKLLSIFKKFSPDLVVVCNVWSSGDNIAFAIALKEVIEEYNIRSIALNFDYYWNKDTYNNPTCFFFKDLLNRYFPPLSKLIKYVSVNNIDRRKLQELKFQRSAVVPIVLDFDKKIGLKDDYNSELRKDLGIDENDLVILQSTKITPKKAVENSIKFVHHIMQQKRNIKFVLAGDINDNPQYAKKIIEASKTWSVPLVIVGDRFELRRKIRSGKKIYSLFDSYSIADIVIFPSTDECFGNQFIEAIGAMKPVVLFEYPVFKEDIKPRSFKYISLGGTFESKEGYRIIDDSILCKAATETIKLISDPAKLDEVINYNYDRAKRYYSMENLEKWLSELIK